MTAARLYLNLHLPYALTHAGPDGWADGQLARREAALKLMMALGLVVGIILIISWRLAELKDPPEGPGEGG